MKDNQQEFDRLLRDLVRKAGPDRPSEGFTLNLMEKVQALAAERVVITPRTAGKRLWILMGIGIAGLIAATAYFLWPYFSGIQLNIHLDTGFGRNLGAFWSHLEASLRQFRVSALTLAVTIAILGTGLLSLVKNRWESAC